ncbi:MAG TPA: ABC transporter permease [Panacibacter sp.]|nr:ABC transporter permease [Panacibacter sp.]HNP46922.1 ABC transporter permease [Panacibacter sp.]
MIRNYLKIAWRNLMKNKIFSFINIFGLSVGLACCMLIALYLDYETSYDAYHKNAGNIYEVVTGFVQEAKEKSKLPNTPAPMAAAMKREFPEIVESARLLQLFSDGKTLLQTNNSNGTERKSFYQEKGYMADASFFKMFDYDFIEGNANATLQNPNTIVLNEAIAKKLFGNQPALNQTVHVNSNTNGEHDCIVTGVFRPVNAPSHIDAQFFLGMKGGDMEAYLKDHENDFASNNMFYSYLQLRPGADYHQLEKKFPAFIDKYAGKDLKAMGFAKNQYLLPLEDIHLSSMVENNVTPPSSKTYLYILASIAIFTLLIACINFMNLSTARSSKRSAEVGIRKVLGAEKGSLVRQFLGESFFMSLIAFVFALALTYLLLPVFNNVSGRNITLDFGRDAFMLLAFLGMALFAGLLAGSYPALYLSSFIPVKVLKGRFSNSMAVASLRKGLVVFQFVISVVLIISSVVIASQMSYMRSKDLGFDKDSQLIIPLRSMNSKNIYASLKNDLQNNTQVQSVGASMYYPGIFNPSDNLFYKQGQSMNEGKRTRMNWVDFDFLKTLNFKPIAGRLFSSDFQADTNRNIVINEDGIKEIGFTSAQQAIGQKVYFDWQGSKYDFNIIGVVKDFHFEDLHLAIEPYAFQVLANNNMAAFNYMVVHAKQGDMGAVINAAQASWKRLNPNEPLEYSFLDADFQKNFEAESRLSSIVLYFTIIAILISCLGLFGLATFSAEQRIKEIGVRKVLGASVGGIVTLLSKEFLVLVGIAVVIASPIAWFVMNKWLQNFVYRTSIGWQVFAITTAIALFIALATISFQAIKAALANPVKSLRTE